MNLISVIDRNEPVYPRLMESTVAPGFIVLFTAPRVGTVVSDAARPAGVEDFTSSLGRHGTHFNMGLFTDYSGTVTLGDQSDLEESPEPFLVGADFAAGTSASAVGLFRDGELRDVRTIGPLFEDQDQGAARSSFGELLARAQYEIMRGSGVGGTASEPIDRESIVGTQAASAMDETMSWCGPGCTCFPTPGDVAPTDDLDLSSLPPPIRVLFEAIRAAGGQVTAIKKAF